MAVALVQCSQVVKERVVLLGHLLKKYDILHDGTNTQQWLFALETWSLKYIYIEVLVTERNYEVYSYPCLTNKCTCTCIQYACTYISLLLSLPSLQIQYSIPFIFFQIALMINVFDAYSFSYWTITSPQVVMNFYIDICTHLRKIITIAKKRFGTFITVHEWLLPLYDLLIKMKRAFINSFHL